MSLSLKFCVFAILPLAIYADYCALEKLNCGERRHIGCEENAFIAPHTWKNIELVDMSTKLRKFLLENINEYRNQIATGKMKGFPRAANMAMMTWRHEFEALMEIAVTKIDHGVFLCVTTDDFSYPYEMSFCASGNLTETEFLAKALKKFQRTEAPTSVIDTKWTALFMQHNHKIGCAYMRYQEYGHQQHTVKCLVNQWAAATLENAYDVGDPCSACEDDGSCSDLYPGLCMRDPMGPSGPTGPPGPPGPPGDSCEKVCARQQN